MIPNFDVILIIFLAGFVFYGLFFGFIRTLGSLAGVVVGILIANQYYMAVFSRIDNLFFGYNNIGKFLVFFILFIVANRLVCLCFSLLEKTFDILSIIPFLKTANRLAGAALGFLLGILVIGLVLYVMSIFLSGWFSKISSGSEFIPFLLENTQRIIFFIPMVFNKLKSWMVSFGL